MAAKLIVLLATSWRKGVIPLIALERLRERLVPFLEKFQKAEEFIERRHRNMGNILEYLGLAKYVIPVIDGVVAQVEASLPTEKADVVAAFAAFKKTVDDTKVAFEALVTAVKTAIAKG